MHENQESLVNRVYEPCPTTLYSATQSHCSTLPHDVSRGGSRNVEGGVLVLCRAVGSNFVLGLALQKAVHRDVCSLSLFSRLDWLWFFFFLFFLDWLSYHLCALHALLTGRLSLSDVLELAILWALLTATVML